MSAKAEVKQNILDKFIGYINPVAGAKRTRARMMIALSGSYIGARRDRGSMSEWSVSAGDADSDVNPDLPILRQRSRDLIRNDPMACGAINTKVTSIVGTGLKLQCEIDRDHLNMSDDEAEAWQANTEAEFKMWCESPECDIARTLNFYEQQELAFRSTLENGDVLALMPYKKRNTSPYGLKIQLVEADRVCNENNKPDTPALSGGVEKDEQGAPIRYHIIEGHPGNIYSKSNKWIKVNAFGSRTHRRRVLHLYRKLRIGQSRGVPDLAPVIETLKLLSRYTEAELTAAVISSFFTVFIHGDGGSNTGSGFAPLQSDNHTRGKASDKSMKLGSGTIVQLGDDEEVTTANPGRPNSGFDPFVLAISRQIGMALELPYEILVKHFTASYSAARAAIEEAWKFYMGRREWLALKFCQPIYEEFLTEAVANGRIAAPGFLAGDPLVRAAYLGARWVGTAKPQIDELKTVKSARERVDGGFSTLQRESLEMNGSDFMKNHKQRAKEHKMREEAGLVSSNAESNEIIETENTSSGEEQ
jgi:lambda family phage portal protein